MKYLKNNVKKIMCYFLSVFLILSVVTLVGCSEEKGVKENNNLASDKNTNNNDENIKIKDNNKNEKDKEDTNSNKDKEKEQTNSDKLENQTKVKFEKHQLDKKAEAKFATKWQNSPNGNLSACIEGKGSDAQEEGIGKIYVKDKSTGEKWSLDIVSSDKKQDSPKVIEWLDDENMAVIVGLGYGTVVVGGDLYKINVNTGKTSEIYLMNNPKKQVISVKKIDDKLNLEILVYDDDDFIKNHIEKITLGGYK